MHAYSDTKGTRLVKGQIYSLREVRRSEDGQVWAAVVEVGNIPLTAFTFCCEADYDQALTLPPGVFRMGVEDCPALPNSVELAVSQQN
jgi:hypothetical protein